VGCKAIPKKKKAFFQPGGSLTDSMRAIGNKTYVLYFKKYLYSLS